MYNKTLSYYELKLIFLRKEYLGLEEKIKKLILNEKNSNSIISYQFFLGEVCMKTEKYTDAKEAFLYVINADINHHRHNSAKRYYNQLLELDTD
jgi:TolA-binding protein